MNAQVTMEKKGAEKDAPTQQKSGNLPSITQPKDGAIRGLGEKFTTNAVTGTGSLSVPIFTSPGRAGFGPHLTLSYDSGSGNGPHGFGWVLSQQSITRKTDKGLPRYLRGKESDVFILSGAEDLVPALKRDENGNLIQDDEGNPISDEEDREGHRIKRYRPRIEGLFALIERWTRKSDGDVHWRSISKDNILTVYGRDDRSRIADPADGSRIFSWLIGECYDDKGNAILYEYASENEEGIDRKRSNERNRVRGANRYIKRILYGNRSPLMLDISVLSFRASHLAEPDWSSANWMFEVVFDYDEGHYFELPFDHTKTEAEQHRYVEASAYPGGPWMVRPDPFSTYRAGFEVRTYRRCCRVLMFHRFPELGEESCLVRASEFEYADLDYSKRADVETELGHPGSTRFASYIKSITQSGFVLDKTRPIKTHDGVHYKTYLKKSIPPLELEYSRATINEEISTVPPESLENMPSGLDGSRYRLADLDGEGISGILTQHEGGWRYKSNLGNGRFGPLNIVLEKPSMADLNTGRTQLLDLAGDGQLDVVELGPPVPGFYERTVDGRWEKFTPFSSLPNIDWRDPNLRFVDLTGDGLADVLITEDRAFTWHPSLAEEGFGPAEKVYQALDEESGPRLVFNDGTQSVYLADMSGDGLPDLVRIRNGEVCYWPNLGYGRFGAKVTMDDTPWFDTPDQFDHKRIRLADIDGSGTTDIIYLGRRGIEIYLNRSGNSWSGGKALSVLPHLADLASIQVADLLGNGTACLIWSSPLAVDSSRPMCYIDLMGGMKPHLLTSSNNNMGAETRLYYASSTRFYLADMEAGHPWITRLPFPVHVVERTETNDRISRNRFVTRYAYHHGFFDGIEREFRGFGMVEQWDTEDFAALNPNGQTPAGTNIDASSHVPPVLTRTWFHTGVYDEVEEVSKHFAAEYYGAPVKSDPNYNAAFDSFFRSLLPDTVIPPHLTLEEEREACRALKGSMLRQEVYAQDGTDEAKHPYTVTEQNFTIQRLQPRGSNRHGVFFTHAREAISYHYERNPADPRIGHALTLEVDEFGNVLKSAAIGYGRQQPDLDLSPGDRAKQAQILITWTENRVTNAVDAANDHRTPLPSESRTNELTGLTLPPGHQRFTYDEVLEAGSTAISLDYEKDPTPGRLEKRLIEHGRTYYRRNNLSGPLALGELQSLALPFESYQLAFTPGLVSEVYGGRATEAMFANEGRYAHTEGDANWWIPSGQIFYSPDPAHTAAQELAYAGQHFFLPHRYRDPFHTSAVSTESFVSYDAYDLLVEETRDALANRVTVGERAIDPTQPLLRRAQDYRVLQPVLIMDSNRNRSGVALDALGMVVGTAVMGKPAPAPVEGDSLNGFTADITQAEIDEFLANPKGPMAGTLLANATTRVVYDLTASWREPDPSKMSPSFAATLAREIHVSDLQAGQQSKIQVSLSYSDGFGREIQKKVQAEPGPVPQRDAEGKIIVGADGQPVMTPNEVSPRWVGSGWTVFNNKGKPVRQYEPFFTDIYCFEFDVGIGVSSVLFYDPVERVVATLHPNHTWEKVVFDPWRQETWDVNDTVLIADPRTDADVGDFFGRLPNADYLPTWHVLRTDAAHATAFAARYPDATDRTNETQAAEKTCAHAATPTVAHADSLGRTVLTVSHNKAKYSDTSSAALPVEEFYPTRIVLDIEGNQREVIDAKDRIVMRYDYDMLGNRVHQASMEAGQRWMLNDVAGKPLYAWDGRDHRFRTAYDPLRRPQDSFLSEGGGAEIVVERSIYGEGRPNPEDTNLRGKIVELRDQAGIATSDCYDFKGNLLRSQRLLARDYKATLDWSGAVPLEPETYTSRIRYDALNRPTQLIAPHAVGAKVNIIQQGYNDANLLERIGVWLDWADPGPLRLPEPDGLVDPRIHAPSPVGVTDIEYNAKGQRLLIDYGNGVRTTHTYDPLMFRLTHLLTHRNDASFPDDCPQPPPAGWPGCQVQTLHYTYDPSGNITNIRDDAQQKIFFHGQYVEPSNEYVYDAVYRLIEATGREHLGQVGSAPAPHDHNDRSRMLSQHPSDGKAMGRYSERYNYDEVGNINEMYHWGTNPSALGWRRSFSYNEDSLIEPGEKSNRLSDTTVGSNNPALERYSHDAHGNITFMPHLGGTYPSQNMHWNHRDQLQKVEMGVPGTAYYVYDSNGQRIRKVWEKSPGIIEERIYMGIFEIFSLWNGSESITLERETLHIMDDKQRIALIETLTLDTVGDDPAPRQLIRYNLGNHLGSVNLELDEQAQLISYEEYAPYGSSTYQAVRSQLETPKRYRYTGKERDEETGMYYHGFRYYIPWLGRWCCSDPLGLVDGGNTYSNSSLNPIRYCDRNGCQTTPGPRDENYIAPYNQQEDGLFINEGLIKEHGLQGAILKAEGRNPLTGVSDFKQSDYGLSPTFLNPDYRADVKTYSDTMDPDGTVRSSDIRSINEYKGLQTEGNAPPPDSVMIDRIEHTVNTGTPREVATAAIGSQRIVADGTLTTQEAAQKIADYDNALNPDNPSPSCDIDNLEIPTIPDGQNGPPDDRGSGLDHEAGSGDLDAALGLGLGVVGGIAVNKAIDKLVPENYKDAAKATATVVVPAAAQMVRQLGVRGAVTAARVAASQLGNAAIAVASKAAPVVAAGVVGYALGTIINEHLSEETKTAIGGTMNEIVNNGWQNLKSFYFGL
jgi:RHS repeat-associated protein